MKIKLFLFFSFFISSTIFSQNNNSKIDSVFNAFEKHEKGMFTVSVSRNGKEEYFRTVGFANLETEEKANKDTKYRIASISKVFTAVLTFKAIEEGKLKQNTKVSAFFPKIRNADDITITNLLEHTSGIKNISELKNFQKVKAATLSKEQLLDVLQKLPSDFPPGFKYSYSNSGYSVLAFILEKLYDKSYDELLAEKITIPLKMTNTEIGKNIKPENNEAKSYRFFKDWRKADDANLSFFFGSGDLVSTAVDLNKFFDALFSEKLISDKSLVQMKNLSQGLKYYVFEEYSGYGHIGSMTGFLSFSLYFPSQKLAISVTENGIRYDIYDITEYVVKHFLNKNYDYPDFSVVKLSDEELSKFVGDYEYKFNKTKVFNIYIEKNKLYLKSPGEDDYSSIYLEPKANNRFRYDIGQMDAVFDDKKGKLILIDSKNKKYEYKKRVKI
jgi:D-alanyl-D-alanine carboxypeptidase